MVTKRSTSEVTSASVFQFSLLAAAIGLGADNVFADPPPLSQVGRWVEPPPVDEDYCWEYGAMHMLHLPLTLDSEQQPRTRILLWYSTSLSDCHPPDPFQGIECNPPTQGSPPVIIPDEARLWDPETGDFTDVAVSYLYDCNGHAPVGSDGKILVIGGGCGPCNANDNMFIFDPFDGANGTWDFLTEHMDHKRWYPTCTTLPDGRVLISSGSEDCNDVQCHPNDETGHSDCSDPVFVHEMEVFDPATGLSDSLGSGADMFPDGMGLIDPPYYPFMFVTPNGRIFFAGPGIQTYEIDLNASTPQWEELGSSTGLVGQNGSAVMYRPGKVLKCGGFFENCWVADPDAAIIDLTDSTPEWTAVGQISETDDGRKDFNLVLMPDGSVVAIGGQKNCASGEFLDNQCAGCEPEYIAQRFDPDLEVWEDLADATRPRGYHSTAILLPSGKILSAGGENWFGTSHMYSSRSAEVYEPWYLFDSSDDPADRPVIDQAPDPINSNVKYARVFDVSMPSEDPPEITQVNLLRLGAPSHGFDQNQRFVPLQFCQEDEVLHVKAPVSPNLAPPGYYLLFIIDDNGIPSEAAYIRLDGTCVADFDDSCDVDGLDMGALLAAYTTCQSCPESCDPCPCDADLNGDHEVDGLDLAILLAQWGDCANCGGGSSMMAGGGNPYAWPLDQETIDWLLEASLDDIWGWYVEMLAQSGGEQ